MVNQLFFSKSVQRYPFPKQPYNVLPFVKTMKISYFVLQLRTKWLNWRKFFQYLKLASWVNSTLPGLFVEQSLADILKNKIFLKRLELRQQSKNAAKFAWKFHYHRSRLCSPESDLAKTINLSKEHQIGLIFTGIRWEEGNLTRKYLPHVLVLLLFPLCFFRSY